MMQTSDRKDWYLSTFEGFEKRLNGKSTSPVHALRRAAIARFAELGFPTTRDEEWRYTNVAPIARTAFRPVIERDGRGLTVGQIEPFTFGDLACHQLVFVNGHYSPEMSSLRPLPKGLRVSSLAAALESDPGALEPHLGRHAPYEDHAFAALNTAFIRDGAFVRIPKGTVLQEPIHLLFVSTARGEATASHPRSLILAEANAQATLIESYVGPEGDVYFTNAVTEVVVGENAALDYYKVQRESRGAFHIARLQVHLGRSSTFSSNVISLGGSLVRNEVSTVLDGEGVESTLNGLYLTDGQQHVDNHTWIEHAGPRGTSREVYKGILDGESKGVFRGRIFVHQAAQKTDAIQSNPNLLLSDRAEITTKPQLEIYADDVRCTHGATIGQLNPDAIFYLRSRGIGEKEARQILVHAFAGEVLDLIRVEEVRTHLDRLVGEKLEAGRRVRGTR